MSKRHPDFTDVFYARAWQIHYARRGIALAHADKMKEAQEHLSLAVKWENEMMRLESVIRERGTP